jgi:diacylglycerol O-acyltransferase / wax synthase
MDALLLYSETPNVHTHTLKIAIIDGADDGVEFGFAQFRETLARRLHRLEPLRYKLVDIPWQIHHPMWLENCDVDLSYHLRRIRVPTPGGRGELDRVIGEIASTPLDRDHPLWEFHYAEGLAHGRCALIGKIHHALADGVASANLLALAMDPKDPSAEQEIDIVDSCPPPPSSALLRTAGRDHLQQIAEFPGVIRDAVAGYRRLRRKARGRELQPDFARPMHAPATFLNHVVSPARTFASVTLPLKEVKQTAKHLQVTINDLVLGISTGALRELSLRHDGQAEEPIVASVPVSTDRSAERITGNEIGGLAISLPVHIGDPVERMRLVSRATAIAKENQELFGQELYGRLMNYIPPALAPPALRWVAEHDTDRRLMNVPISNVAGPREYGYLGGARVSEMYSVGPLAPGCGMNITVWSYVDQFNICVISDDRTLDDTHEATEAMVKSFREIRSAYGL